MLRKFIKEYKNAMTQYGSAHIVISESTESFSVRVNRSPRISENSNMLDSDL